MATFEKKQDFTVTMRLMFIHGIVPKRL